MYNTEYGIGIQQEGPFEDVVTRTVEALAEQGFGILSDIDVKATLKKKLDVDFRQYRILGACNPPLAYQALTEEVDLGLLLPCNVIVYETGEGQCVVAAINPVKNLSIVGNADLEPVAEEVRKKLKTVLTSLEQVADGSEEGHGCCTSDSVDLA